MQFEVHVTADATVYQTVVVEAENPDAALEQAWDIANQNQQCWEFSAGNWLEPEHAELEYNGKLYSMGA